MPVIPLGFLKFEPDAVVQERIVLTLVRLNTFIRAVSFCPRDKANDFSTRASTPW